MNGDVSILIGSASGIAGMTHWIDCSWCIAQEHNPNVSLVRKRRSTDGTWFDRREWERNYHKAIGQPIKRCGFCGCDI